MTADKVYTDVTTPTGRIVSGNPFRPWTKDKQGNALTYKSGPNQGQPRMDFSIGLAVAKADSQPLFDLMTQNAAQNFPTLFEGGATPAKFSWKYVDGDSNVPNENQVIPNQKEGYPGHYVFFFSSDTAPKCFRYGDYQNELLGTGIKTGDYVMLAGSLAGNGRTDKPGIYLNLDQIALVSEGAAIGNQRSAEQAFGGANAQVPAGAVLAPTATAPGAAPAGVPAAPPVGAPPAGVPAAPPVGAPPAGVPAAPPVGAPPAGVPAAPPVGAPPAGVPAAPPATTQPHAGILNPQVAAPVKRMYQGTAWEESQLLASGWPPADVAALPLAQ